MPHAMSDHMSWLRLEGLRLLDFSKNARIDKGFCALDIKGCRPPSATADGILTARMTHSYALGAMLGLPGCQALAGHGVRSLLKHLSDKKHGGWVEDVDHAEGRKQAYYHAFVALAGASASAAELPEGPDLMRQAENVIERHFWSEKEGVMLESFAHDWQDEENYRGANANMHATEAFLAMATTSGDPKWLKRAMRILERFVHILAMAHDGCMPEHFDAKWNLLRDYNIDRKTDPLRPYGLTPGHFAEWAHLTLKAEALSMSVLGTAPSWMLDDAKALFQSAIDYGWLGSQGGGIAYTIDWQHAPCVEARAHWVQAEAVIAANWLYRRTGDPDYLNWYKKLWDYIDLSLIDRMNGSWRNEVDAQGEVSGEIYPGKADLYHAFQSTLSPRLPLSPSLAQSIQMLNRDDAPVFD